MNIRNALIASTLTAGLVSGAAHAELVDRGGGLIYDTDLDVTWLSDANYAQTSGYDADGLMTWGEAVTWAANLAYYDSVRNVTYADWRLPTTDTGTPSFYVDPASSEIAHLYFTELGNLGEWTASGEVTGAFAGGANPYSTLDNTGPFINFQSYRYWSGTEYAPNPSSAWAFDAGYGRQNYYSKTNSFYALAVRPGDVAAVPEAQTYAMLLAGLGLVGWRARRR